MEASRAGTGAKSSKRLTWKYHWTEEEDELLRKLVKRHGPGNWKYIANHIEGRTGMSCRLRWVNHLNPKVDKTPFSEEEQEKLLQLHRDFGNKWSAIVSYFPGRTDNQVKNQFHAMMSRRMKHSIPSSGIDGRGCLNMGPAVLSGSDVLMGGSRCIGCAGCLTLIREKTNMPLTSSASSSIYGRDETWSAAPFSYRSRNGDHSFGRIYLGNMYANLGTSHGNSLISDASPAISELCPEDWPQQGVSVKNYQFIDFLGVGNGE